MKIDREMVFSCTTSKDVASREDSPVPLTASRAQNWLFCGFQHDRNATPDSRILGWAGSMRL